MANEGYSILDVINDEYGVILTRNGCVSVAFRMYNPECYSLHRTDLEERNARLYQAFKHLPSGSFVHKQDVFLKREYVHELEGDSFIDKAEQSLQELMNLPTREKVDSSEASYIGISGESVPTEVTQAYGIPAGVLVDSVEKNGPADQAGIQKGDIITALDTRSVGTMSQLQSALEYYAAGEKVKIVIQRSDDGKYQEKTLDITLGAAADAQQ